MSWKCPHCGTTANQPRAGVSLSVYVPETVVADYTQACLIKDTRPRAAARLFRRSLQGMVRDFWGVTEKTLREELNAIKPKCDSLLYLVIARVRSIGNISGGPERDIDLILEVEEGEVEALSCLIPMLDKQWYVCRAENSCFLASIRTL